MEQYLNIDQVAEFLQLPKSWIYERTRNNTIPHYKMGKYLRFKKSDLDTWISKNSSLTSKSDRKRRP
ncbi:MAG: helix-turn-helix domain-containing protein [Bdellovibrionaceae bacterium]|nr:helix-turn-helix domain-containing protein [Pseudobdellovibrionaceae bacterium]